MSDALAELSVAEKAAREDKAALAQTIQRAKEHIAWRERCSDSAEIREEHKRESAAQIANATANAEKSQSIAEKLRAAHISGTLVDE